MMEVSNHRRDMGRVASVTSITDLGPNQLFLLGEVRPDVPYYPVP